MDYIPILELVCFVVAGFVLVGTVRGLRSGEVHMPVRWLFEAGYKRDDPKFGAVVICNIALSVLLIAIAVGHVLVLNLAHH